MAARKHVFFRYTVLWRSHKTKLCNGSSKEGCLVSQKTAAAARKHFMRGIRLTSASSAAEGQYSSFEYREIDVLPWGGILGVCTHASREKGCQGGKREMSEVYTERYLRISIFWCPQEESKVLGNQHPISKCFKGR